MGNIVQRMRKGGGGLMKMETKTNMLNDVVFVFDEQDNKLKVAVKFQAMIELDEFQKLVGVLMNKSDGEFKTTLV